MSSKGVIVTNYHVVADARTIQVLLPTSDGKISLSSNGSRPYEARVLKTDKCFDLALLQIPLKTPRYLQFADDDEIHSGDEVTAVGNPEGLTVSVSKGVVIAVRSVRDMGVGEAVLERATECRGLSGRALEAFTLVQTDASINPGNSGGPLLSRQYHIIGVNTLMGGIGLNFAIHVKHVRKFVGAYAEE